MTLILTVALLHLMAVMSPGPDLVVCMKNTLQYSRATGVWTALGFACGVLIHIAYSLMGIAFLISQSVVLFNVVKFIGAAYLIYLGVKALLATSPKAHDLHVKPATDNISALQAWRVGFLTNLLNPKATLYFLGFFSVVLPPDLPILTVVLISALLFVITFAWFALVALGLTFGPIRSRFLRVEKILDKVFGGVLILLGLKVATAKL